MKTLGSENLIRNGFKKVKKNLKLIYFHHSQDLTKLQLKEVKEKLKSFFKDCTAANVTSLYFTERKQWESGTTENLLGLEMLTEELLGKKFQISPKSYFAVNTAAAEVLYNAVSELVQLNLSCTLVDICCGTGSIGLSLSDRSVFEMVHMRNGNLGQRTFSVKVHHLPTFGAKRSENMCKGTIWMNDNVFLMSCRGELV